MIRRLSTTDELAMAERLRDVVVSGEASLAAEWLARSTARVIVQESGRHLEHEEAPLVAQTFGAAGVEKLFAISIDSLFATPEAYDLVTSADNLDRSPMSFYG